jgi:hypothetical protein
VVGDGEGLDVDAEAVDGEPGGRQQAAQVDADVLEGGRGRGR